MRPYAPVFTNARIVAFVALVVLVVVGACGGQGPTPHPPEAISPTGSAAPTEAPMPVPSASPSGPTDLTAGELAAGTYRNAAFRPPVTMAVDDGWTASIAPGFFDVQQRGGTPEVVAVQVGNVEGVVGPDGDVVAPADAADAARILARHRCCLVLGESDSRLGGLEGRVVELLNASDGHVPLVALPPGTLGIDAGRSIWIAFLDTPADGVVAVMVGGPSDGWDEALALAEPVLESIRIGE